MARVRRIQTGSNSVEIKLTGGSTITLGPNSCLENADVENIGEIRATANVREDLSEIGSSGGKTKINGRRKGQRGATARV